MSCIMLENFMDSNPATTNNCLAQLMERTVEAGNTYFRNHPTTFILSEHCNEGCTGYSMFAIISVQVKVIYF